METHPSPVRLTARGRHALLAAAIIACFVVGILTANLGVPGWSQP